MIFKDVKTTYGSAAGLEKAKEERWRVQSSSRISSQKASPRVDSSRRTSRTTSRVGSRTDFNQTQLFKNVASSPPNVGAITKS